MTRTITHTVQAVEKGKVLFSMDVSPLNPAKTYQSHFNHVIEQLLRKIEATKAEDPTREIELKVVQNKSYAIKAEEAYKVFALIEKGKRYTHDDPAFDHMSKTYGPRFVVSCLGLLLRTGLLGCASKTDKGRRVYFRYTVEQKGFKCV